jgi:uncharacterized protein (TIGR02246 family)
MTLTHISRRLPAMLLLLGVLWPALAAPLHADDRSGVELEIAAIHARYLLAFNRRDATALAALFAEDGLFVDPSGNVTAGRAAIEAMFAQGFAGAGLSLRAHADQTGALVDGGWEIGHGAQTITGADGTQEMPLHYAALFTRGAGGLRLRFVSVGAE